MKVDERNKKKRRQKVGASVTTDSVKTNEPCNTGSVHVGITHTTPSQSAVRYSIPYKRVTVLVLEPIHMINARRYYTQYTLETLYGTLLIVSNINAVRFPHQRGFLAEMNRRAVRFP